MDPFNWFLKSSEDCCIRTLRLPDFERIGIERKINKYLLFDQQNVLQQIWQPESTNTALFHEKNWNRRKNR